MISRAPSTPCLDTKSDTKSLIATTAASCSEVLVVPSCLTANPRAARFASVPTTPTVREAMAISVLESFVPLEESLLGGGEGG
jgi:hypothetical protein